MEKRIVFKNQDGSVGVIIPSTTWTGTLEELAAKDIPQGCPWRIVDVSALPMSRNWRNAWVDENPTGTVGIDLGRAKEAHLTLMVAKAYERVPKNSFGQQDFTQVNAEIEAISVDNAGDFQELYNLWPASIEVRSQARNYKMHAED